LKNRDLREESTGDFVAYDFLVARDATRRSLPTLTESTLAIAGVFAQVRQYVELIQCLSKRMFRSDSFLWFMSDPRETFFSV
jgi:hypothetical protein